MELDLGLVAEIEAHAPARLVEHRAGCSDGVAQNDVRLVQLERAQERDAEGRRWHSMYWATGKLYSYRFHSGHPIGCMDPTQRLYRHQERRGPLCLDRMQAAADYFVGEHDFASFANKGATTVTNNYCDK